MGASDQFNLFDPSAHRKTTSPKKTEKKMEEVRKLSPKITSEAREKLRRNLKEKDPELEEWLSRMDSFREELKSQVESLMEKKGHSPESLTRYLDTTSNFSKTEQNLIFEKREELDKTLGIKLDPSLQRLKKKKSTEKSTKERQKKTLGARKRWMDMH